jgi:hypothetical protein
VTRPVGQGTYFKLRHYTWSPVRHTVDHDEIAVVWPEDDLRLWNGRIRPSHHPASLLPRQRIRGTARGYGGFPLASR